MRGQPGHLLCSRNARSRTPLVGRAHYGDKPGYPRRETEKEKAPIENLVRAFDSQDSVGRREVAFRWKLRLNGTPQMHFRSRNAGGKRER